MASTRRPAGSGGLLRSTALLAGEAGDAGARTGGLRLRLVLIVGAVGAAVWLSTLFDTVRDRAATLTMAERQHDNIAGALAEQAARALQATDLILQQAALLDPDNLPPAERSGVIDPLRQLHLSTAPNGGGYSDLSDRPYYLAQRARADLGLFVSGPFISRVTGEPTFVLSRRLPGDTFHGIVGAAVDVTYIRGLYQALDLGAGSAVELLRTDGTTLVSRDHRALTAGPSPWARALPALGSAAALHTVLEEPHGARTRLSLRRVPGYPAVVAVGRSEASILEGWRENTWKTIARTFVISALAAVLLIAFL